MRTRSQKLALENAGAPPSPPQQLPAVTRAPRKKTSPAQQEARIDADDPKVPNSEASRDSLVPNVHPVQAKSRATRKARGTRPTSRGPSRVPSASTVATATEALTPPGPIPSASIVATATEALTPPGPTPSASTVATATEALTPPGPKTPPVPQALIHVWVDAAAEDLASAQPVNDPSIVLSVPSELIQKLIDLFATNPVSNRQNKLTISEVVTTISISPSSNKRKLPEDADLPPPAQRARIEPTPTPAPPKARKAFRPDGLAVVLLEPSMQRRTPTHYVPSDTIPDTKFFKRVDRYTSDGRLQLGLEPVTISSEEGSNALFQPSRPLSPLPENQSVAEVSRPETDGPDDAASSDPGPNLDTEEVPGTSSNVAEPPSAASLRQEHGSVPETPQGSRWGLGTLMNTARRYLPSLNRRPDSMIPVSEYSVTAPSPISASTSSPNLVQHPTVTDAEPKNPPAVTSDPLTNSTATNSREHREHQERRERRKHRQTTSPSKNSRPMSHAQSDRRKRGEHGHNPYRERAKALEALRVAEMATTTGTKRKRLPSPDTIPNPRGCSYGMDLDYFGYVSSDEGDEIYNTPTKPRRRKSRRIGKPGDSDGVMVGDSQNALPYSGVLFTESDPAYHGGNVFGGVKATEKAVHMASETKASEFQKQAYLSKTAGHSRQYTPSANPITNLKGSFQVPEPSDSDSDHEESPRAVAPSSAEKGKGVTRLAEAPTTAIAAASIGKPPELWNQSPPPRPTPGHKSLPSAPKLKASEPLSSLSHNILSSNGGSNSSGSRLAAHHVAPLPVDRSTDSEALRKVREKALQHKPRKPSTLSQSSRLYSSPPGDSSEDVNESTAHGVAATQKDTGRKGPAVQADTRLGATSKVTEAQEIIGYNQIIATSADTLPADTSNVDKPQNSGHKQVEALQAHTKLPDASNVDKSQNSGHKQVEALQAHTKLPDASNVNEPQNSGQKQVEAPQAHTKSPDASNVDGHYGDNQQLSSAPHLPRPSNAYEKYRQTLDPEVAGLLAKNSLDVNVLKDVFIAGITDCTPDADGKRKEGSFATIATAVPSSLANIPSPVGNRFVDPMIANHIDSIWVQADDHIASTVFEKLFTGFVAGEAAGGANAVAITAGVAVQGTF